MENFVRHQKQPIYIYISSLDPKQAKQLYLLRSAWIGDLPLMVWKDQFRFYPVPGRNGWWVQAWMRRKYSQRRERRLHRAALSLYPSGLVKQRGKNCSHKSSKHYSICYSSRKCDWLIFLEINHLLNSPYSLVNGISCLSSWLILREE